MLYIAPNCPRRIVAPNCPRRIVQRRIVRAELSAPNCPAPNCPGTTKSTPDKTFQTKTPGQNHSDKIPCELRQISCKNICIYVHRPTDKIRGSKMCDVGLLYGGPEMCDKE